jgi:hypothetical protein
MSDGAKMTGERSYSDLSDSATTFVSEPSNVINMKLQGRLIREAREARAKRKAERDKPEAPQFPGGIDDMEI